jgi:hypothetical protein
MRVKQFLLNQKISPASARIHSRYPLSGALASVANAEHPSQRAEIDQLAEAIQAGLRPSLEKNGAFYEVDLHAGMFFHIG